MQCSVLVLRLRKTLLTLYTYCLFVRRLFDCFLKKNILQNLKNQLQLGDTEHR